MFRILRNSVRVPILCLACPLCGGQMKVIAFIRDYADVDRIIDHLKLTFAAEKPPHSWRPVSGTMSAAEESGGYFMD